MKKETKLKVLITRDQLTTLILEIDKNEKLEPSLLSAVILPLCEESDFNCLSIDEAKTAEQPSAYIECDSYSIHFK